MAHVREARRQLFGHRRDATAAESPAGADHEYLHDSSMAAPTSPSRDLDVIVVSWNSAAHLAATLATLPAWCRVIVVDNASVDASVDVARAHGAEVIELSENIGFPAGVNR